MSNGDPVHSDEVDEPIENRLIRVSNELEDAAADLRRLVEKLRGELDGNTEGDEGS